MQTSGPYGDTLSFTPMASEGMLRPNGDPILGHTQASIPPESGKEDNIHQEAVASPSRQLFVGQMPAAKQAGLAAQPSFIAPGTLGRATAGDATTVSQHSQEASAQEASAEQADNGLSRLQATLQLLEQVDMDTAEYVQQLQAIPQQPAHFKEDPGRSQGPGDDNADKLPLEPGLQSIDAKADTVDVTEQSFRAERQHTGDDGQHHDGDRQPIDDSGQGPMGSGQHPVGSGLLLTSNRQHCEDDEQQDAIEQHALLIRHVSEPAQAHLPAVAEAVAHCSDQQGLQEILSESNSQCLSAVERSDDAVRQPTAAEHAVRQEQDSYNLAVESSAG